MRTCPNCKDRSPDSFYPRCRKCGHNLMPEPARVARVSFGSANGCAATETVECKIVGADAAERTLTVEIPEGVRGVMLGEGATITLKRHNKEISES